jgi:hypothetical protein
MTCWTTPRLNGSEGGREVGHAQSYMSAHAKAWALAAGSPGPASGGQSRSLLRRVHHAVPDPRQRVIGIHGVPRRLMSPPSPAILARSIHLSALHRFLERLTSAAITTLV